MPRATWVQSCFNAGEISPLANARYDLKQFKNGLAKCQDWFPTQQGGLTRRPGTRFAALCGQQTVAPRLQRFEFSITQAYILEFGAGYIRFFTNDGQLLSGGLPYQVSTSWSATDVWLLNFSQSADALFIAHPNYPPMVLKRLGATNWTLTAIPFVDGPYGPLNTTATTLAPDTSGSTGATASFATNVMTLTGAATGGTLAVGHAITASGVPNGVTILALASGVLGQVGSTYTLSATVGTIASESITTTVPLVEGSVVPVTASAITGINKDTGFQSTDVGRLLRIKCGGVWLWGTITTVTDTTHIKWTIGKSITGTPPTTAKAVATISGGSVYGVSILDGGAGYGVTPPSVSFSGGGGSGVVAYATLTQGVVTSITITVTGSGYSSAPTVTMTPPTLLTASTTGFWRLGLWNSVDGYPGTVTFHQDRLVWAGTKNWPNTITASSTGDYYSHSPTNIDGTVVDSNALNFSLSAGVVNVITWMSSDQWGLLVGTAGGEWLVAPSSTQQAITPTNINAMPMSNYGCAAVPPLKVGKRTLFLQRTLRKIRELEYQFYAQTFQALDISLLGEHLTQSGIKQMALLLAPQQVVWMVRNDGVLVGMTYDKDQEVLGWHQHRLGGYSDDAKTEAPLVHSVASIPSPTTTYDELWLVVQRFISGATVFTVEYMAAPWQDGTDLSDAIYLDSSVEYSGVATTTISGLTWLKGQTVGVLTNGATHPPVVVSGAGSISLQWETTKAQIGLPFASEGQTLCIEAGGAEGPSQGKTKRLVRAVMRLFQSVGISIQSDTPGIVSYPENFRTTEDSMDQAVPVQSGDFVYSLEKTWNRDGSLSFSTDDPLPCNINMLMVQLDTQDNQ
jgi:hypothetical protein